MAKKNQQTVETSDESVQESPGMTVAQARVILASPDSAPIQRAHAQRAINAAAREAMPADVRAKADFSDLINDAADRIYNGGKRTIFGACGRFSTVSRESGVSLVSNADLIRGLDYLRSLIQKCEDNIGTQKGDDKTGFAL